MSFGAAADGTDGLFHGRPGGSLAEGQRDLLADLPACDGNMHGGEVDPITHKTHEDLIKKLNTITGLPHGVSGGGEYDAWPHSQSLLHEQMHVTAIHRAYQGGLRLMVASVTGNQMIGDRLWRGDHDAPSSGLEFDSAARQLDFIKGLASKNADWMQVVTSPLEARQAIKNGKLAVVLGVEMDSLDATQLRALSMRYGVRTVIPIHLADNPSFGGTAAYEDLFNANNHFLNGEYLSVEGDANLSFRLGRPNHLAGGPFGAVIPAPVSIDTTCGLGYSPCPERPGHRFIAWQQGMKNTLGINKHELRRLLRRGLILDVVHMGEKATEQTLDFVESFDYPVMYSHGGIRQAGAPAGSERALLSTHAERIAASGGVLGLGTEGDTQPRRLVLPDPGHRFEGSATRFELNLEQPVADRVEVAVATGGNGLLATTQTFARLELRGSSPIEVPLNDGEAWAAGSAHTVTIPLPDAVAVTDVLGVRLRVAGGADAFWTISGLGLTAISPRGVRRPVVVAAPSPTTGFVAELSPTRTAFTLRARMAPETPVARAIVRIWTGPGGNGRLASGAFATGSLLLVETDGRRRAGLDQNLNAGATWESGTQVERTFTLPEGTRLANVGQFLLRFVPGPSSEWAVSRVSVTVETASGDSQPVADFRASEARVFKWDDNELSLALQPPRVVPQDAVAAALRLNLDIKDEMDSTGRDIHATVRTVGGTTVVQSINFASRLRNDGLTRVMILLPAGTRVADLDRLTIDSTGTDAWDFARVMVDVLADPVVTWTEGYTRTLRAMGNRGVALGTDINGMAPQVPFTRVDVPERIDVAASRAPESLRATAPTLDTSRLGRTVFRFEERGLAHFGMLPDFLQAVATQPTGDEALTGLFRSAEDFLVMWDKVLAARSNVSDNPDRTRVRRFRVTVGTGGDDLRCDSNAEAFVALADGNEVKVALGNSFANYTRVTREFELPAERELHEVQWFGVRGLLSNGDLRPCAGASPDNWNVESARLEFLNPGGSWETFMFRRGHPLKRMDHAPGNQEWKDLL